VPVRIYPITFSKIEIKEFVTCRAKLVIILERKKF